MQAFLYRHLMPAQTWTAMVLNGRGVSPFVVEATNPLKLHPGGSTHIHLTAPQGSTIPPIRLELRNPPPGVAIGKYSRQGGSWKVGLECAPEAVPPSAGNLIFEAFPDLPKDPANPSKKPQSMGYLPAVPYVLSPP